MKVTHLEHFLLTRYLVYLILDICVPNLLVSIVLRVFGTGDD